VSYLQCPECRLTVPALAYWLRGDECPRCMTAMTRQAGRFAGAQEATAVPPLPAVAPEAAAEPPAAPA
jgi:uncharacterized paraquat-inducible protein A